MPNKGKIKIILELVGNFCRNTSYSVAKFFKRLAISFKLMPAWERVIAFLLAVSAFSLIGYKVNQIYLDFTVLIPDSGGEYSEVIVGEVKTLNPISVQTDAERSISGLIFPGLLSVGGSGEVTMDLAERYEVSENELVYKFFIRPDVRFHDGEKLKPSDVHHTIEQIKSPEIKSSLLSDWKDITVDYSDEENWVSFELPSSYGPFVYKCDFGIIPSHIDPITFSRRFVGTGKYIFEKGIQSNNVINQIQLKANKDYWNGAPYIDTIIFSIFESTDKAIANFEKDQSTSGIFGANTNDGFDLSYQSQKQLILFVNSRVEKLKDKAFRERILVGQGKVETDPSFTITCLDNPTQREAADKISNSLTEQGFEIEVKYLGATDYQSVLSKKNYEILVYGFETNYDRDPYPFWHSSQIESKNFSGWSDKATDILIEDARMLLDPVERNNKYNQFYTQIGGEYLFKDLTKVSYDFSIRDTIKGVVKSNGNEPWSRFDNIEKWYIKEKRVRK